MSGRSAVISVIVTGEADKSVKGSFDDIGKSADGMRSKVEDAGKGFDKIRDAGGDTERRMTGLRDSVTGTKDVMAGLASGDVTVLATGFADLGGAVESLGGDLVEWGTRAAKAGVEAVKAHVGSAAAAVKDTAAMVAHKAASMASAAAAHTVAAAQWVLNAAMSANPIMLVVLGLAALVAAFVLAWQHSETFRAIVTGAFDAVRAVAEGAFNWVRDNWPLLLAILTGPIGLAVLAITRNWDTIKSGFGAAKDWIGARVDELVGFFTGLPGRISAGVSGAFDDLKEGFRRAINWIIDKWNGIGFKIGGWDPPGPGPTFPGIEIGPKYGQGDLPRLAAGGIVTAPTLALIGEGNEPEAVVPLSRAEAMGFGDGGAGDTITVDMRGATIYGIDDLDRRIVDGIARAKRRGLTR